MIAAHKTIHTGQKPNKCTECSESFVTRKTLKRHMRFHGATLPTYNCEFCFKQLSTGTSLREHIRRLHSDTPMIKCVVCRQQFATRVEMKNHLENEHGPFNCKHCDKTFSRPRSLKLHERQHLDTLDDRQSCPVCAKFLCTKKLKSHMFRTHKEHFDVWMSENP